MNPLCATGENGRLGVAAAFCKPNSAHSSKRFNYKHARSMPSSQDNHRRLRRPLRDRSLTDRKAVRSFKKAGGAVAVGEWEDGRIGAAMGIIGAAYGFGFTAWRRGATISAPVDASKIYPTLLEKIRRFVETGDAPVAPEETLEAIAFMEAANESMAHGGVLVKLRS